MPDRPLKRFYEFDAFRLEVNERRLMRSNEHIPLTPKVFDVLLALVENTGRTLGKDELMNRVWAESFVEDGNLNRNISTLRKMLGEDSRHPGFIKTVPKLGYRFEADVREVIEEDEEIVVEKRTNYRLALQRTSKKTVSTRSGSRLLVLGASVFIIVMLGAVWLSYLPPTRSTASGAVMGSSNSEAVDLYKSGRARWQDRSVEGLHQATVDLERAVQKDPEFALAHAALADAYAFDVNLWKKAEPAANEAIRLDPNLGQPYATIGFVRTFWEWKLPEAETYFKQALALSPDSGTAHQWYSINLALRKRGGAALAEMKRALELEPASLAINADLCQMLYFSHKFDAAIDQCLKSVDMDPNFINAHAYLYEVYTAREMYNEAIGEYFKAAELSMTAPDYPSDMQDLRTAYAVGGIRSFWKMRAQMLETQRPPDAFRIAKYNARLGQNGQAMDWLERAYEAREFDLIYFATDPVFRELGADPRFTSLRTALLNEQ